MKRLTQTVERLDYSAPPPGYAIAWRTQGARVFRVADQGAWDNLDNFASEDEALAAAWVHYKLRHDPPGMCVDVGGLLAGWPLQWFLGSSDRAAAWAWHDERLALAGRLAGALFVATETFRGRLLRTVIPQADAGAFIECTMERFDVWPVILTWSKGQIAETDGYLKELAATADDELSVPKLLRETVRKTCAGGAP